MDIGDSGADSVSLQVSFRDLPPRPRFGGERGKIRVSVFRASLENDFCKLWKRLQFGQFQTAARLSPQFSKLLPPHP